MNNRYREEEKDEVVEENDSPEKKGGKKVEITIEDINPTENESEDESSNDSNNKKEKKKEKELKKILETEINNLKDEVKKIKDQYLRTLAEAENFKKRIDEERIRERKYGSQRLLEKLIPITDIFDKVCSANYDDPVIKSFIQGFIMINDNIKTILEEEGVKKIKVEEMFDPRYQQAMETDYDENKKENEILAVLRDGYMYKDRVLVYAMVKVNKKPEDKNENNLNEENK